jgi:hypothetical protein
MEILLLSYLTKTKLGLLSYRIKTKLKKSTSSSIWESGLYQVDWLTILRVTKVG